MPNLTISIRSTHLRSISIKRLLTSTARICIGTRHDIMNQLKSFVLFVLLYCNGSILILEVIFQKWFNWNKLINLFFVYYLFLGNWLLAQLRFLFLLVGVKKLRTLRNLTVYANGFVVGHFFAPTLLGAINCPWLRAR